MSSYTFFRLGVNVKFAKTNLTDSVEKKKPKGAAIFQK